MKWAWVFVVFVLLVLIHAGVVRAHDFYDPWCCNESDCAPYKGVVETRPGGYWIPEFQTLVPYRDERVKHEVPWEDEDEYHLCEWPKGVVRCFYVKQGGV
jgi:hypothetical protein